MLLPLGDAEGGAFEGGDIEADDMSVPTELRCALTNKVMRRPVIAADGYTYERVSRPSSSRTSNTHCPAHVAHLLRML